jgi:hypothetical protein
VMARFPSPAEPSLLQNGCNAQRQNCSSGSVAL